VPAPRRPAELIARVFRGSDAIARGLVTRDALRSRCWRRLFRDVYADADLPDSVDLRIDGAALLLPPSAVFSGRTAVHLWGVRGLAEATTPVEVTVPPSDRFGPVAGVRVRQSQLRPSEVTARRGHRCTSELRTALDVARLEPLPESVTVLDALLARCIVSEDQLREGAAGLSAGRGVRSARQAVALADERAESPPESRLRVLLTLAGLPPVPQFSVRRDGVFLARVDLAYPDRRVAVEYDGAWHGQPGELGRDRRRLNALVAAGWRVLHVTAADMHRPDEVVARVRSLLGVEIGHTGP
jgi:very-short-patch-repair endonuclease